MNFPEQLPAAVPEEQFVDIVSLILETNERELRLIRQVSSGLILERDQLWLGSTVLATGTFSQAEMEIMDIDYHRLLINANLQQIGGLPCSYTRRETGQEVRSSFIAWHGLVKGRLDQHLWSPALHPDEPISVSAGYLDQLRDKYFNPAKKINITADRLAGYL